MKPGEHYCYYPNGTQKWFHHGTLHRDGGPAIIWAGGIEEWYQHGLLHRTDGPAKTAPDGRKEWWLNNSEYDQLTWLLKVYELDQE